jgi:oligoribonuclease
MRPPQYISIDVETTGLDSDRCQLLEFGAVIETDWRTPVEELPTFHCYLDLDWIVGEPYALALNSKILNTIALKDKPEVRQNYTFHTVEDLPMMLAHFAEKFGLDPKHLVAAGKNFGAFDLQFIKRLPTFGKYLNFKHRHIDPAMLYWDIETDSAPPSTKECMKRAGIEGDVSHTAVEDARVVIELVRRGQDDWLPDGPTASAAYPSKRWTKPSCIASSPVSAA